MTTIANIILNQIKAIDGRAMYDWGCARYRPIACNDGNTLRLKSGGMVAWKGYIEITYDHGNDLYNIEFFKMRLAKKTVKASYDGVYVDQLVELIDGVVLGRTK